MMKTKKVLRVEMPDGSEWDVPAEIIADNRASYYASLGGLKPPTEAWDKVYKEDFEDTLQDDDLLLEWAANQMDWLEVEEHAIKVSEPTGADYQESWVNGRNRIITIKEG